MNDRDYQAYLESLPQEMQDEMEAEADRAYSDWLVFCNEWNELPD